MWKSPVPEEVKTPILNFLLRFYKHGQNLTGVLILSEKLEFPVNMLSIFLSF